MNIKDLSVVDTKRLEFILEQLQDTIDCEDLYWMVSMAEDIRNLLIPAEKLARTCISFGEQERSANSWVSSCEEGYPFIDYSSSEEIVNAFINNEDIIW